MGSIITLVGAITGGTESNIAAIDVPANGVLQAVDWAYTLDADAGDDLGNLQLSFGSAYVLANDSRQLISSCRVLFTLTTSGVMHGFVNRYVQLPDIPVGMGERIYLHHLGTASTIGTGVAHVHFDFNLDLPQVRRR